MVCPFAVFFSPFFRRAKAELKRSTRPSKKEKEIKILITFSEQQSNNKKGLFSPSLSERVPFSYFSCEGKYKRGGGNIAEISVAFREREGGGGELSPPSPSFFPWGVPPPLLLLGMGVSVSTAVSSQGTQEPAATEETRTGHCSERLICTLYMHFMSRAKHSFENFF